MGEDIAKLRNLAQESMALAADALSQMSSQEVTIETPSAESMSLEGIYDVLGSKASLVVGVFMNMEGDLSGSVLLLFPEKTAYTLIDYLMSQDPGETSSLDDMGRSALQELCNVMVGNYVSKIADHLDLNVSYSVPYFAFDMVGSILEQVIVMQAGASESTLVTKADIHLAGRDLGGYFLFLLDEESATKLIEKLNNV